MISDTRNDLMKRSNKKAQAKTAAPVSQKPDEPARKPLSRGRLWLFRLTALTLPFVFLIILEILLRIAGVGYPTNFFRTERGSDGKDYLLNNDRFTLRFFPPELARWPGTFKLLADKPSDVQRIFIFGESAAMGDPQPSVGASRYLQILLREKFPDQKFEIVNLGITAINSHVILPIAEDVAARGRGDIWLIYMGNNEMVGPFGAATVFGSRAPALSAVRFNLVVQKTRVGQLAVNWLRNLGGKPANSTWGGMKMFLQNQIPPDDTRRETVYKSFGQNLRDIVALGRESGARIVLSTMSVNLRDCPPFASMLNSNLVPTDRAQFDSLFNNGIALQTNNQHSAAAQKFEQASKLDATFAELQFRWAQSLLSQTNLAAARERFQRACDVDALPFRADTRINRTIREVAKENADQNFRLCDAETALASAAPDGFAGDDWFFEHVHFNFDGNYRLAKIWAENISAMLPETARRNVTADWLSQSKCEHAIGLSVWNRDFVVASVLSRMTQPPLSAQFNNPGRAAILQGELNRLRSLQQQTNVVALTRAVFDDAVTREPDDSELRENYANFLEAIGDRPAALAQYRKITEIFPHDFYGCLQTGRLLGEAGQRNEARDFLNRAAARRPSLPEPWYELGIVAASENKFEEALGYFDRAAKIRPQDGNFLSYKAKVLSRLGRRDEAITIYREAIRTGRGGWEAHFELAGELAAKGEVAECIKEYSEVLRINPRHAVSHVNLGVMLVRQNRLAEAMTCFETALQLDPGYREARDYLNQVRARVMK
jgi:tetratricopeptide (TPR) repeat protein